MTPVAVLVVEDERIIAKGIEKQLKGMGYAVAGSAASGAEAVRMATELRPDLILMDISLGAGIDGVEAARLIRADLDVPVVYLTANSDDSTLQRAKATDPFGYVLKPYEDGDLQTAIEIGLYRHRMERRLRENEQWFAATLGSIGDGVVATDERGRVRFLNALAEQLTGWSQADALGRDIREIFRIVHEGTREPVENPVLAALEAGRPTALAADTLLVARGGAERPIDDSAAPIRGVTGKVSGAVLVFRDITERRRLEEHLRQSQKMEAVGRLAGGIAHDFNNIMAVITGMTEILLADDLPAGQRGEFLRDIADAGKRATALTQQILAFGRQQLLAPRVLDLNAVVRDMAPTVRRLAGPGVEVVTDAAADLGRVRADPAQVGQVVLNLAAAAQAAMPGGGRLVVATANAELAAGAAARPPDVAPGRYAVLSVSDTGAGLSDADLAHVFEPFFSKKEIGQGAGLGLATAHGIVKQSGGHIEARRAPGGGTTYRAYFPLVGGPAPPGAQEPRPGRGHETVLLVEDEPALRRVARAILERGGYAVLEASDGAEAVAVGEGHPGPLHLLVTDLATPRLSGREVAERLAAARPGLRVLFVSASAGDADARRAVAGAGFLQKPFGRDALTAKVREVLDGA